MQLSPGTQLGPYEILATLGAGGMGEVYRARDTRLDRMVAIKVLPAHLAKLPELRERFEREARAVSSLSHPHICTLHDIGRQDDIDFLVMEYLEGETLASRLARGPLPLDQTLKTAVEIADALDKAHRQGVTHRDLKPSNIMLTKTGAKLMDFGLAKLKPAQDGAGQASRAPTVASPTDLTAHGTILGTLQYMSPEQLEGFEADARSDLFAFGAVLYEMLTGRKAFEGRSQSSIIGAIIHVEPPGVSTLQPMTPPAIERIVKICLSKKPEERWQTAHDLYLQLQWIRDGGSQAGIPAPVVARRRNRERLVWASLAVAILVAAALAIPAALHLLESADTDEVRFSVETPTTPNALQISISPDGRKIVFLANSPGGQPMLYVRPINSLTAQVLPGTENALHPFWSPDSRHIGFGVSNSKLKRVDVSGGPPQSLCDLGPGFNGGAWNAEGDIVFSTMNVLHRVSAAGGVSTPISALDPSRQESGHLWPQFLPDGQHYLYLAWSSEPEKRVLRIGSLDSGESSVLIRAESQAYVTQGFLVFQREGTLLAQPFDADRLQLAGEPVRIAEDIILNANNGRSAFALSSGFEENALVYRSDAGPASQKLKLTWVDRSGKVLETVGVPGAYQGPNLSPDGKRVAIHRHDGTGGDVWIVETPGGKTSRFTFDASFENGSPIWSPDGSRIAFGSKRNGKWGIYQKASNNTGREELLVESETVKMPMSWSGDGKFIMYWDSDPKNSGDIWAISLTEDRKAFPVLETPFHESHPQVSPDGKFFAYYSNETGRSEIYVQSFPPGAGKWQISTNGGVFPRWRPDGKELFYTETASFSKLMSVTIKASGSTVESSTPVPLFDSAYDNAAVRRHNGNWNTFAVSADGRRFLIPRPEYVSPTAAPNVPITVVLNWKAALRNK